MHTQLSFCVFWRPVISQFSKDSFFFCFFFFFQNLGAKWFFSKFPVLSLIFESFCLPNTIEIGFQLLFCVSCCSKRRKSPKRQLEFLAWFLSQNGRFVKVTCFSKICLLKSLFVVFFWVHSFWAKLSKKGNFAPPPKKILTDNSKAHFGHFLVFLLVFFCFLFVFDGLRVR